LVQKTILRQWHVKIAGMGLVCDKWTDPTPMTKLARAPGDAEAVWGGSCDDSLEQGKKAGSKV
jgi:hypothetical protein